MFEREFQFINNNLSLKDLVFITSMNHNDRLLNQLYLKNYHLPKLGFSLTPKSLPISYVLASITSLFFTDD